MKPLRLAVLSLFVISSLAIAQEFDVVPAYTAEEVAKLSDEQLLAIALTEMKDDTFAGELEACVDVGFLDPTCGGGSADGTDVILGEPVCIQPQDAWPPLTCGALFEPLQYTNLSLRDRFDYFKGCLSGDTHEGDTCLVVR